MELLWGDSSGFRQLTWYQMPQLHYGKATGGAAWASSFPPMLVCWAEDCKSGGLQGTFLSHSS